MTCPRCKSSSEMAYSALLNGFVCLNSDCGFELEMESQDVQLILQTTEEELVLA